MHDSYRMICKNFEQFHSFPSASISAIDSITQNEESKIEYDYVIMTRNNTLKHTVEELQKTLR